MPTPVGAEVAERRLDEEKFSLVAEGGTAILALSAGTLKRPPLRLPLKAFESDSFSRTSWYFLRVGNSVRVRSGCGRDMLRDIAVMMASFSSSESTGPPRAPSRSSSRRAGALASIAASVGEGILALRLPSSPWWFTYFAAGPGSSSDMPPITYHMEGFCQELRAWLPLNDSCMSSSLRTEHHWEV